MSKRIKADNTLGLPTQVHAAEGGSSTDRHGREARAGRLTRQKVRGG